MLNKDSQSNFFDAAKAFALTGNVLLSRHLHLRERVATFNISRYAEHENETT